MLHSCMKLFAYSVVLVLRFARDVKVDYFIVYHKSVVSTCAKKQHAAEPFKDEWFSYVAVLWVL